MNTSGTAAGGQHLAEKAGTSQRVVSLLEAGKYNPSLSLLERLAEAMNLRLEVTFGASSVKDSQGR